MRLFDVFMDMYRYISSEDVRFIKDGDKFPPLTYMDFTYLDIVFLNEGCRPSFIAERLNIARSAVTVKLYDLEEGGWIEKIPDESDRRSFRVVLTEQSMELYKPMFDMFESFEDRISDSFSEKDVELFISMMRKAMPTNDSE